MTLEARRWLLLRLYHRASAQSYNGFRANRRHQLRGDFHPRERRAAARVVGDDVHCRRKCGRSMLSLPAWTPGAYEIDNFARNVANFTAEEAGNDAQSGTSSIRTPGASDRGAPAR